MYLNNSTYDAVQSTYSIFIELATPGLRLDRLASKAGVGKKHIIITTTARICDDYSIINYISHIRRALNSATSLTNPFIIVQKCWPLRRVV